MTITNKYIVVEDRQIKLFDTLAEAYKYSLENVSRREIYKRVEVKIVEQEVRV